MKPRPNWIAGVALLMVGFALGSLSPRLSAQQPANTLPASGRYVTQVAVTNGGNFVVVSDSLTGRVWTHQASGSGDWTDYGLPTSGH